MTSVLCSCGASGFHLCTPGERAAGRREREAVRIMHPSEPLADGVGANLDPGDLYGTDEEG